MSAIIKTAQRIKEHPLLQSLKLIDPFLCFLTKKSGHIAVSLVTLAKTLPPPVVTATLLQDLQALVKIGILRLLLHDEKSVSSDNLPVWSWSNSTTLLGFPPPADSIEETPLTKELRHDFGSLHGSTKLGAKRRVKALGRVLERRQRILDEPDHGACALHAASDESQVDVVFKSSSPFQTLPAQITPDKSCENLAMQTLKVHEETEDCLSADAILAQQDLEHLLGFSSNQQTPLPSETSEKSSIPTRILNRQVSYAGTHPAQQSVYQDLSESTLEQIPPGLLQAFGLVPTTIATMTQQSTVHAPRRRLYRHQACAIEATLNETHCTVSTGTGSGKSLCFLMPVLTAAYQADRVSFILYPTKALAQDQLTQLQALLRKDSTGSLASRIRPATLDGDTPHSTRAMIADTCNVILTNPDTLHASILPNWRQVYGKLLSRLSYVALDEAHLYEGVFGAHVAMILSRLLRVSVAAANHEGLPPSLPTFIATSATMPWPEELFRQLCPIAKDAPVLVLSAEQDGSPRSAKHFLLWNPPLLQCLDHTSSGQVVKSLDESNVSLASVKSCDKFDRKRKRGNGEGSDDETERVRPWDSADQPNLGNSHSPGRTVYRRHAAEETALLLARALVAGVRCIAFCRTRNLVEWVYERTVAALKSSSSTAHLVDRLESYRGGYSKLERREIEQKLFRGELLGVVGTNALELGVDIGGINLTLHCGYPSSYASLLQQAGRAGRDKKAIEISSCSVVICFDSPVEQHLWRHPKSLLGQGVLPTCAIPITRGLVQSHLLCASEEFPLTKDEPVAFILGEKEIDCLTDRHLFGEIIFDEAFDELQSSRELVGSEINVPDGTTVFVYQAQFSHRKAWAQVSIRAIEPVNYSLVNLSHPGQCGQMDAIHDEAAVMDTIPYSRVFYYSHPGAIILHRGTRFKIVAMSTPPSLCHDGKSTQRGNLFLAAFARPTKVSYFTRPLSNLHITVVKTLYRMEVVHHVPSGDECCDVSVETEKCSTLRSADSNPPDISSFAGCGTITVKRRISGYAKLSLVTRTEISRSELSLPEFEYDTFGIWLDVDRDAMLPRLGENDFGAGVHALSHALLAVVPIFVPGVVRQDLECDHSYFAPRRIMLFDERAGGAGACQRLWSVLFQPNNVIEAAVDLLEDCRTCSTDTSYEGGCPACLHTSNCLNFNLHLNRSAGAIIGRHLLSRLRLMEAMAMTEVQATCSDEPTLAKDSTPRRLARERGLREAKEIRSAGHRQFVVGRPSWPLG